MVDRFIARAPDYSDLDLDFIPHPTTGDVVKKTGVDAIKRAVRNLVLTNFYDRPFRSYIGSNVQKILFDNINPMTAGFLKNAIWEVIRNFEPRVELTNVTVNVAPDNNGYNVILSFIIVNRGEPYTFSLFLERIR
jgi:phage baseplate assembly protein W